MTPPRRHALRFFALLLGLCVLFMWPWRALEAGYGRLFVKCGNRLIDTVGWDAGLRNSQGAPLYGLFSTTGAARLHAAYDDDPQHDVQIMALNFNPEKTRKGDWRSTQRTSSRHVAYMPTVTLLALILATPIPRRRKAWALLWGLLLVHLFIVVRFGFLLLDAFHGDEAHCLFQLNPPWRGAFNLLVNVLAVVPATTYLVPLVIWILVSLRRDDLTALLSEKGTGRSTKPRKKTKAS